MVLEGRFPSKTRWGTSQSCVPSAFTCSGVFPKASASVWAKTLARSMSWCRPTTLRGFSKAMKSQGDETRPLVDQLIEGVLSVRARLSPVDGAGIPGNRFTVQGHVLPDALHR